ncbi:hypothetical protein SAMN02910356_01399 [Selenomonas sp. GACV-9]|uniref:hypothetical protein n=1 Tax=unclassified Selenomonas TaxID=2637378 RepID=UPI0008ED837E|nr:hypothetical protein [Selenomonas sp.]MCR5438216.1 hypothetical protein [Selenomonas sp.]SFT63405.1 hypothetical protein SAMN02910356_01399 [Selenomonas ruminantium]
MTKAYDEELRAKLLGKNGRNGQPLGNSQRSLGESKPPIASPKAWGFSMIIP